MLTHLFGHTVQPHFYRTGTLLPFPCFWRADSPRLTALPIPPFSAVRRRGRGEEVVV